ncbi:transposase, partial [Pseudoalteromonas nigrifaciens]|uniref:transposase n=1 Tax=Pseudoalteromonas nigrifaciens TaxID=28109 RepID=UPI0017887AA0
TTQSLWSRFKWFKKQFWVIWVKKTFWSDGYFVCSVGNAAADTIQKYIQEQG